MEVPSASRTTENKATPLLLGHSGDSLEQSRAKWAVTRSSLHSFDDPLCCRVHLIEVFHVRFPIEASLLFGEHRKKNRQRETLNTWMNTCALIAAATSDLRWIFLAYRWIQHDNDPKHSWPLVRNCLQRTKRNIIDWPAQSFWLESHWKSVVVNWRPASMPEQHQIWRSFRGSPKNNGLGLLRRRVWEWLQAVIQQRCTVYYYVQSKIM